ncbi:MAG: hypothetical protein QOG72_818 [Sphingomonadales bacterium]|jgi:hypothetical protein|nr:hypothetical protein [Sphingomonadales bacterium]
MKLGQPLRFPAIPEQYESLIGLVARATADHVLLDLNRVLRRAGISMDRPGHLARLDPDTLVRLAPILGCTEEQVLSRALPGTVRKPESSTDVPSAVIIKAHDLEIERRRISPLAIARGSHHRESWLLRFLPYCPSSYELLRSDCSECGAPLRWKKSLGIGLCETCGDVVAPSPAPLLEDGLREDYTVFSDLLSSCLAIRKDAVAALSAELRHVDIEALVQMVLGLGACVHLKSHFANRKRLHALSPQDLGRIIATGTQMLRDWPCRLQTGVRDEAARLNADGPRLQKLRERLHRLGNRALVAEPQARLIREALPEIFCNVQRSFKPRGETVLRCEARIILGLDVRLMELVDAKLVEAEELALGTRRQLRFSRSVIEGLRRRMDASHSLPTVAQMTGLTTYAIENLCDHGVLERETDRALHYLRHAVSLTRGSLDGLRERLFDRPRKDRVDDAVPLRAAVRRIGGRLKPWSDIINALLDESIGSWIDVNATPDMPWLRSILVHPSEIARFENVRISGPAGRAYVAPHDCSIFDAKEILNLHGNLSIDLQDVFADEIGTCAQWGPRKAISMNAVIERAEQEISIAEVCARADWNPRKAKWALGPLEGYRTACGWSRKAVEESGVLTEQIDWNVRAYRRSPRKLGSI